MGQITFLCVYLVLSLAQGEQINRFRRKIPDNILFGAGTSAYQIEGAWNIDGRTESVWDHMSHKKPCQIHNCDNGDIAADSYNNYERDVQMMKELGLDFYRFSISWSRVLPTNSPDDINEAGVAYYNKLINEMLKYNITPMVTIHHLDVPLQLDALGGWVNPNMVDWFVSYARVVYELFGDRVKTWFTINEPREYCTQQSSANKSGINEYLCARHMLLGHAKAYYVYQNEFKAKYGGKVGIVLNSVWYEPESEKDAEAAEVKLQFELGQYAHPIFSKTGDWPSVLKDRIAAKSAAQGFSESRLPEFTPEEVELIKGSSDFFGLNHYTSALVYRNNSVKGFYPSPSYEDDIGVITYQPETWEKTIATWLKVTPWGFYKLLNKIREDYGNPPLYVTENGCPTGPGLFDTQRVFFYKKYLNAMLDSIDEGSDVRVYTAWSLMDNFEWFMGYHDKFGLYEVDFNSPTRTRTPRASVFYYKKVIKTRRV
ncbi:myrosinase 1 isoform X3 [Pieris rapae]|uniref:myrosinase 1 isoform X3 n=1 Tax=Pieris rapae TaxID=64459 RepID=UPI001E281A43|nr:myrosinase 1 isoform X3 [Pieris rapae]